MKFRKGQTVKIINGDYLRGLKIGDEVKIIESDGLAGCSIYEVENKDVKGVFVRDENIKRVKKLANTRLTAKTPKFFRILRNIGIAATIIGTAIATSPITLPVAIVGMSSTLIWIGGTAATVSQLAKE